MMKIDPNYVPKERRINYKVVLLLIVLALGLSTFIFYRYTQSLNKEDLGFKICELSSKETTQRLSNLQETVYNEAKFIEMKDYNVYGETLKLYHEDFDFLNHDIFIGNTVFLNNICGLSVDEKIPYLLSHEADIGIQFAKLEDGFYEVEILKDFDFHYLISTANFDEVITAIKRDDVIKQVRIFANKDLINQNQETPILIENMLYLEVSTLESNDLYDIVIDPAALNFHDNGMTNYGHFYGDIYEADETYKMAVAVKENLEAKGLRVYLTRDNENPIDYYSETGRIVNAYNSGAKYYVHLRFESSGSSIDKGLSILYSNKSSNRFATNIAKQLINQTQIQTSPYLDGINMAGVYQTSLIDNMYDYNDLIREVGGNTTGAGNYDIFSNLMAMHQDVKKGMYGVDILYGYMTDTEDYNHWIENFDAIAKATAEGILIQLELNGGE